MRLHFQQLKPQPFQQLARLGAVSSVEVNVTVRVSRAEVVRASQIELHYHHQYQASPGIPYP